MLPPQQFPVAVQDVLGRLLYEHIVIAFPGLVDFSVVEEVGVAAEGRVAVPSKQCRQVSITSMVNQLVIGFVAEEIAWSSAIILLFGSSRLCILRSQSIVASFEPIVYTTVEARSGMSLYLVSG